MKVKIILLLIFSGFWTNQFIEAKEQKLNYFQCKIKFMSKDSSIKGVLFESNEIKMYDYENHSVFFELKKKPWAIDRQVITSSSVIFYVLQNKEILAYKHQKYRYDLCKSKNGCYNQDFNNKIITSYLKKSIDDHFAIYNYYVPENQKQEIVNILKNLYKIDSFCIQDKTIEKSQIDPKAIFID